MKSRLVAAAVVVLALLGAGCSDGDARTDPKEPAPVPGGETTKPTAPAKIDVSVIPEKIDERYINAVLAALRASEGAAVRVILRTKRVGPEATKYLAAVYDQDELQDQVELWLREVNDGLRGFKEDPTPARPRLVRTLSASRRCLLVEVEDDVSGYVVSPGPFTKQFLLLTPVEPSRNEQKLNPTAWMIHDAGLRSEGSDPEDLCAEL